MISTGTLGIIVVVPLPALKVDNSIHCVVRLNYFKICIVIKYAKIPESNIGVYTM